VSYRVEVGRRVQKTLARFPRQDQARLLVALKRLAEDPRPTDCLPVKDATQGTYRLWVGEGDYLVIYTVLDGEQVVVVARIARRSESTYRRL
jgi:mRNA interferase RelE/StbE